LSSKNKTPVILGNDVGKFLAKVAAAPLPVERGKKGRLVFAMDATASREATWDHACQLQGEMFNATTQLGGLSVQLCYYRGFNEFHVRPWCDHASQLLLEMGSTRCLGGHTQIGRVLSHLVKENSQQKIQAAVFVGDAMEESADALCQQAGKLGVLGIPLFIFQEGRNSRVASIFKQLANLTGGAYAPFDLGSASQLKDLLSAVAVYAAGGHQALAHLSKRARPEIDHLLQQLKD
jgi:hypothetical protein